MSRSEKRPDPFVKKQSGLFVSDDDAYRHKLDRQAGPFIAAQQTQDYLLGVDASLHAKEPKVADFLPRVEEAAGMGPRGLLYKLMSRGRERAAASKSIGRRGRIPASQIEGLEKALQRFESALANPKTNGLARSAFASFRLPDADEMPGFYRLWGPPWSKRLLVLWGTCLPGNELVPWRTAIEGLKKRSRPDIVPKLVWFGLIPLLCLVLLASGGFAGWEWNRSRIAAVLKECDEANRRADEILAELEKLRDETEDTHKKVLEKQGNRDALAAVRAREIPEHRRNRDGLIEEKRLLEKIGGRCRGEIEGKSRDADRLLEEISKTIKTMEELCEDLGLMVGEIDTDLTNRQVEAEAIQAKISDAKDNAGLVRGELQPVYADLYGRFKSLGIELRGVEDKWVTSNLDDEDVWKRLGHSDKRQGFINRIDQLKELYSKIEEEFIEEFSVDLKNAGGDERDRTKDDFSSKTGIPKEKLGESSR